PVRRSRATPIDRGRRTRLHPNRRAYTDPCDCSRAARRLVLRMRARARRGLGAWFAFRALRAIADRPALPEVPAAAGRALRRLLAARARTSHGRRLTDPAPKAPSR